MDVSKSGIVYPFTGLRGDAKDLYKKIKNGNESLVQLVRADTIDDQKAKLKDVDIVIQACGY